MILLFIRGRDMHMILLRVLVVQSATLICVAVLPFICIYLRPLAHWRLLGNMTVSSALKGVIWMLGMQLDQRIRV